MKTERSEGRFSCKPLGRRDLAARFNGGDIASDGGSLLLRELEARAGIIQGFAECFTDHRDPGRSEHTVEQLVAQRVYGLALGYEDLKDFEYRTRTSWRRPRRVVGKAERPSGGPNPRFVVTSISKDEVDARELHEDVHCARGEMENRIKEPGGLSPDVGPAPTRRAERGSRPRAM